jgi:16S rRNA (guanine966-N2)-methyltransferase
VPALDGLRPTPDRVRETLFNWLATVVPGAACLDLFAGSGALGFEAASRGAARVVMVDRSPRVVAHLRDTARRLGAAEIEVVQAEGLAWLDACGQSFDVVFLDPPFGQGLLVPACERLQAHRNVRPGGLVYLESEHALGCPPLPPGWAVLRSGKAGEVRYHLVAAG